MEEEIDNRWNERKGMIMVINGREEIEDEIEEE